MAFAVAALAAAMSLAACGSATAPSPSAGGRPGSPQALRGLQGQANQLLDGGPDAFQARLEGLRGYPIVVNQWASWCGPCRYEFPFFQRLAKRYEGRVAFLGVDSKDARDDAAAFLARYPTPYPHFYDQDGSIARIFRGGRAFPTTAFYDGSGRLTFTHAGGYATQAKLDEDIRRYALGNG